MSFAPLVINCSVTLNAEQVSKHFIDKDGNSALECYADSIFSVIDHSPSKIYSENTWRYTEASYTVTRILKSDVDLLPNTPVILTSEKVSALRIKSDGCSNRPELSQCRFQVLPMGDNTYKVTKLV